MLTGRLASVLVGPLANTPTIAPMYPACIVASPRLLESRARTVEQTRLINTLCRFAEMAGRRRAWMSPAPRGSAPTGRMTDG
jgi:hypothetical protein